LEELCRNKIQCGLIIGIQALEDASLSVVVMELKKAFIYLKSNSIQRNFLEGKEKYIVLIKKSFWLNFNVLSGEIFVTYKNEKNKE
jgi:hypothetical protein